MSVPQAGRGTTAARSSAMQKKERRTQDSASSKIKSCLSINLWGQNL